MIFEFSKIKEYFENYNSMKRQLTFLEFELKESRTPDKVKQLIKLKDRLWLLDYIMKLSGQQDLLKRVYIELSQSGDVQKKDRKAAEEVIKKYCDLFNLIESFENDEYRMIHAEAYHISAGMAKKPK